MSTFAIATTIAGGFILAFLVSMCWGPLVEKFGPAGGWMAAGFIIGTVWLVNHGLPGNGILGITANAKIIPSGLIVQGDNAPWVDMAWAAAIGTFANGIYNGGKLSKSLPTLIAVILGGIVGGVILGITGV